MRSERRTRSILLLAVAAVLGLATHASGADSRTAALRLDGVSITPELALTPGQRALGLMHRRRAPEDGMLFVFPGDTTGGFWMKNTLVPLTIVFFDRRGMRVRKLSMTPCRASPCRIYDPGRRYRFALELPASDPRPAVRLGPTGELHRLTSLAT